MIYLIRHGEAAAGWGTHPDPGLSATGKSQATDVALVLTQRNISQAYTSPMQRCQETGSAFSKLKGMDLSIEPAVTEIPTPSDIDDRISWLRGLMSGSWSNAPDIVQEWRRGLISTVQNLPANSVVFTHFVAINAIVGHLENTDDVTVFRPNYCSLTKVDNTDGSLSLLERGQSLETKVL